MCGPLWRTMASYRGQGSDTSTEAVANLGQDQDHVQGHAPEAVAEIVSISSLQDMFGH